MRRLVVSLNHRFFDIGWVFALVFIENTVRLTDSIGSRRQATVELLMANVQLERVSKQFPDGTVAVNDVNLEIEDREFLVLVGPSGCGKSTTLRLIAGLETNTSGDVRIGGRVVTHAAPKDRDIAMVFQSHALYPQMSVYRNLSFGLMLRYGGGVIARGLRKIFRSQRAAELAQLRAGIDQQVRQTALRLGIENLLDRKPHQLSGGERQRVALGRAIVRNPAAFLFDEPLSNLDANLRQQIRVELKRLHRDLRATMIYVTHDHVEAMMLGDRVAVMNDGKILQVGRPLEVYQRPANLFVAKFIGPVPMNICRGTVRQLSDRIRLESRVEVEWRPGSRGFVNLDRLFDSGENSRCVVAGFRSEDVKVSADTGSFEVEVVAIDRLGDSAMVYGRICSAPNENWSIGVEKDEEFVLVRHDAETKLQTGDRVRLLVEPDRWLWFDPESGENLLKE